MSNVTPIPFDWRSALAKKANGEPYGHELNVMTAFERAPELRGLFLYDEFRDRIEFTRPFEGFGEAGTAWVDVHCTLVTTWLQRTIQSVRGEAVQRAVELSAKKNAIHPLRDYLKALRWDGKARIDTWLHEYMGAKDDPQYLAAVGPKFLIGSVARILLPGCQMDTILVFEGSQGLGKSTAVRIIAKRHSADMTGDLATKDAAIHIQGTWIVEMSELSAIRRSDVEVVKAFITRRIDRYRPPYGRNSQERPRQCVFVATTNDNEYLQDATGNRRFWPVECSHIRIEELERDIDQLWAEAVVRYYAGDKWYLDASETRRAQVVQVARHKNSPVDLLVLEYADGVRDGGGTQIEMRELLRLVFDLNTREDPGKAGMLGAQAARVLTREGWVRLKAVGRGAQRRQYYVWNDVSAPVEIAEPPKDSQDSQGSQADSEEIPF